MSSMPATGIIYYARNKLNGKVYIGQTIKPLRRRKCLHRSVSSLCGNNYFGRALLKYGLEGFDWEILSPVEAPTRLLLKEYLNIAEQMFIEQYDSMNRRKGYNSTEGGAGTAGSHHSIEVLKKMSEAHKGHSHTEETRKQMSETRKNLYRTEEMRKKLRKAQLGKILSDEHKKKISEANRGHRLTEETKKKISESRKGKKNSEEARKKMSESHKGLEYTKETRSKMSESARKRWSRRVAA